jgi:hypothetical protein
MYAAIHIAEPINETRVVHRRFNVILGIMRWLLADKTAHVFVAVFFIAYNLSIAFPTLKPPPVKDSALVEEVTALKTRTQQLATKQR